MRTLAAIFTLFVSLGAQAHGGGTNAHGCHNDNVNGGYHCHNGGTRAPIRPATSAKSSDVPQPRFFDANFPIDDLAAEPLETFPEPACLDNAESTVAIQQCQNIEYENLLSTIGQLHSELRAKAVERDPQLGALLDQSHSDWTAYLQSNCNLAWLGEWGGTLQRVTASACAVEMAKDRKKWLEEQIESF